MRWLRIVSAALAVAVVLAGCSFASKEQREAEKITKAVIANDMTPVIGDFTPLAQTKVTRVAVAELSDELNSQGAFHGLKPTKEKCPPAFSCFIATYDKATYFERIRLSSDGKVASWWTHNTQ